MIGADAVVRCTRVRRPSKGGHGHYGLSCSLETEVQDGEVKARRGVMHTREIGVGLVDRAVIVGGGDELAV